MRKTMKTAAVVAAMSAMTIASASVAFAAAQKENVSSVAKSEEAVEAGESFGEWIKTEDGWKFAIDGKNLKDTWAEIDGVWYYFEGEIMAQEDFLYIDNKGYYFDQNGTMATGWQKIRSNTDAYDEIEISEQLLDKDVNAYVGTGYAYDYYDYVWCYFNEDGTAKENEWFQDVTGLHYYFDNHVMVMNIMNYVIDPDNHDFSDSSSFELYGFDENGAMLTGWNTLDRKNDKWNDPTWSEGDVTYYYYDMDGTMQKAGWAKIDGTYYLFADTVTDKYADEVTDGVADREIAKMFGYPLIVNSYVTSNRNNKDIEYFYVDAKGKMVTGVKELPRDAWKVTFYQTTGDDTQVVIDYEPVNASDEKITLGSKVKAYFGDKGAATPDSIVNSQYFVAQDYKTDADEPELVVVAGATNARITASLADYSGAVSATTGSAVMTVTSTKTFNPIVEAQLVENAFIDYDSDELYLADGDGNFIKNKAILISTEAGITMTTTDKETDDSVYNNAYILLDNTGKARTGYTGKQRSFTVGGVTYWATNVDAKFGDAEVTVFVSNKEVYKQH